MTRYRVKQLSEALRQRFNAEVEVERVGEGGRYRFAVIAPRFGKMTQLQRQDAVWEVVDAILPREATLDISLILTYAPRDLAEMGT